MRPAKKPAWTVLLGLGLSPLFSGCALVPNQLPAEELARIRQEPRITVVLYRSDPRFGVHLRPWEEAG